MYIGFSKNKINDMLRAGNGDKENIRDNKTKINKITKTDKMKNLILKLDKEYSEVFTTCTDNSSLIINPHLLISIILQESMGNTWAMRFEPAFYNRYIRDKPSKYISRMNVFVKSGLPSYDTERQALATSYGLFQIMGATARERGCDYQYLSQLFDPFHNIYWVIKHLEWLCEKLNKGEIDNDVLYAYNRGFGMVKKSTDEDRDRYKYVVEVREKEKGVKDVLVGGL